MPNGIQYPFGDVFLVNTPSLKQWTQILYNNERQNQLNRQQQARALDDEMRKNVSNMRDADIPDYTNKYEEWKRSRQELMKMSPINNKQGYIQKQLESQRKLAELQQFSNASKQAKSDEDVMYKNWLTKPDDYADEFGDLFSARRKTPLSALSQYKNAQGATIDLSNPSIYRYNGINFDFSKILKDAKGGLQQRFEESAKMPNDDLTNKVTQYWFGNSPNDYAGMLAAGLGTRQGQKFAANQWANFNPEVVKSVQDQFKSIDKNKWKQITGDEKPQDLIIKEDDPTAVKFAKHMAQLYALNEKPEMRYEYRVNQQQKDARDFSQQKQLEGIRFGHQKELAQLRKSLGLKEDGSDDDGLWIDAHIQNKINSGTPARYYDYAKKQWVDAKEIGVSPIMEESMKVNGKTPDFAYAMPDGKIKYGLYKRKKDKDGNDSYIQEGDKKVVDMTNVRTITQEDLKASIGKRAGVKQMNREMSSTKGNNAADDSYSRQELKKAGWTDAQIQTAVKAGKIKVHD